MRVGLVLDQIIFEHDGQHSTDEVFIRFIDEVMARRFDSIEFCSRVRQAVEPGPYALSTPRYRILPLPWYDDVAQLCLRSPVLLPRIARRLAASMSGLDLVIAFGVHPLTPLALRMARRRRLPAVLWIRGDLRTDLRYRLSGLRRPAALLAARLLERALPAEVPVISVGRRDYPFLQRLGSVHVVYSSKFDLEDFVDPDCRRAPDPGRLRLLYVGRLAAEKGLEVLLQAVNLMQQPGRDVELTLVGSDHHGGNYGERFRRLLAASQVAGRVRLVGHIPYGPRLFACYDSHDLLVLPSFTEGFPQVLLEAMARALPVVATAVGGVPAVVRDGHAGLLVPPGQPESLAAAMVRLVEDPALAKHLARHGQETARCYTRSAQIEGVNGFLDTCFPTAPFTIGKGAGRAAPAVF